MRSAELVEPGRLASCWAPVVQGEKDACPVPGCTPKLPISHQQSAQYPARPAEEMLQRADSGIFRRPLAYLWLGLSERLLGTWLMAAGLAATGVDMQFVVIGSGRRATLAAISLPCHEPECLLQPPLVPSTAPSEVEKVCPSANTGPDL